MTLAALLLAVARPASAQIGDVDEGSDFGARISATVDKKIVKGLHLNLGGEVRLEDNFGTLGRYQGELGVTWKPFKAVKLGAGYVIMENRSDAGNWKLRHRIYTDASVTFGSPLWRFQIKERLQLTHKDVNAYKHQTTPNSLALKSRFKVSYRGFTGVTPYGYVEARNVFNDPSCTAVWSTASEVFTDYQFTGYDHAYFNRLRGCLGAELDLDKHNSLDFYLLTDWCKDKEIDTYSDGTRLRSLTWEHAFNGAICVGYKFSF